MANSLAVGDDIEVDIERVAHGGHCVARHEGQVLFVRHTAPGERVRIRVTGIGKSGKFVFADAVHVLVASPHRVTAPCAFAGHCGGCDFQHLDVGYQRELKRLVLIEQLTRLGKIDDANPLLGQLRVRPLSADETGLDWRTRMEYSTDSRGRIGLKAHGSHDVVTIDKCVVAAHEIGSDGLTNKPWAPGSEVRAVVTSTGERQILPSSSPDNPLLRERVGANTFAVYTRGFWQSHRRAPEVFTEAVCRLADAHAGDHVIDLYAGAGLFSVPLIQSVGEGGRVDAVEGDSGACKNLRANLRGFANAAAHASAVEPWLARSGISRCDVVVLDPPRVGAGKNVVQRVAKLRPRTVVYVACDPAALARDVAYFTEVEYTLARIEAFDAFPMSHHFETIAVFTR